MDTLLTPEIIQQLLAVGGAPVAILIASWLLWNKASNKYDDITNSVKAGFKDVSLELKEMNREIQDSKIQLAAIKEWQRTKFGSPE